MNSFLDISSNPSAILSIADPEALQIWSFKLKSLENGPRLLTSKTAWHNSLAFCQHGKSSNLVYFILHPHCSYPSIPVFFNSSVSARKLILIIQPKAAIHPEGNHPSIPESQHYLLTQHSSIPVFAFIPALSVR
jgi:hypothetical protein